MGVVSAALALAGAAVSSPSHAQPSWGGRLSSGVQARFTGCGAGAPGSCRLLNFRNANVLGLTLRAPLGSQAAVAARVDVRNVSFADVSTLADTGRADRVQPVDLQVHEAALHLYGFLLDGLDVSVGAQRLAWGVADRFNPTDRLNAYDFEDPTRFDRRLASVALAAAYHLPAKVRVEATLLPLFVPARLPIDEVDFTGLGDPQEVFDLGAYSSGAPPQIVKVETPTSLPEPRLDNMQVALRLGWQSPVGDWSVGWFRGFDSLPQAHGTARLMGFQTANRVNLGVPLIYPRLQMFSADFRGPLVARLGGWCEAALILPSAAVVTADRAQLDSLVRLGIISSIPDPLPQETVQSDTPYVSVAAGLDWTFASGVYVNAQYLRGLMLERQASDLHHYGLAGLRWPFGSVALLLSGGVEVAPTGALGSLLGGGLAYLHGDSVQVSLGATWLRGAEHTSLQRFADLSHARLEVSATF